MIQVFFFGPDYVALIKEDGERVVLTIDEAMKLAYPLYSASGILVYTSSHNPVIKTAAHSYAWSTPNLVKQIIHDVAETIYFASKLAIR